jgi:hypothetical protein
MLGSDATQIGGRALPVELTPFGAPGCYFHVAPSVFVPAILNVLPPGTVGSASVEMDIPIDSNLQGGSIYGQWMVADPGANALNVTFSNGFEATVGPSRVRNIGWLESSSLTSGTGRILTGRVPVIKFKCQ